jgi:hypothetical protein
MISPAYINLYDFYDLNSESFVRDILLIFLPSSAQAPASAGLSLALFSISLTHPPPTHPPGKVAKLEI